MVIHLELNVVVHIHLRMGSRVLNALEYLYIDVPWSYALTFKYSFISTAIVIVIVVVMMMILILIVVARCHCSPGCREPLNMQVDTECPTAFFLKALKWWEHRVDSQAQYHCHWFPISDSIILYGWAQAERLLQFRSWDICGSALI